MTEQSIGALAHKIVDPWTWWQSALKAPSKIGSKELPVHDGDPQQGYYRTKQGRRGGWAAVAIWRDEDGNWLAYQNGREANAVDIWTWVCRHPVTYEAYEAAIAGNGWPDDDAVVAAQVMPPVPTIGDNSGQVDEAETLRDQIEAAVAGIEAYKVIADDDTAAKALSLRNRLNELSRDADKIRAKEKEPFLEGGRAVDARWQPLVKKSKAGADQVRNSIGAWETKKLQEQRKREREAEEARIAAEKAAIEQHGEAAVLEAPAPAPAPVEAAPASIRPTYGKAAAVKAVIVVKEVTDWPALAVYMSNHPECQDLLRKLAQRAIDAGRTNIPGIVTEERASVR